MVTVELGLNGLRPSQPSFTPPCLEQLVAQLALECEVMQPLYSPSAWDWLEALGSRSSLSVQQV